MKLSEAIQEAANERDPFRRRERIEECTTMMRFQLGWTAAQCQDAAMKSGVTAERRSELMMEIDNPI